MEGFEWHGFAKFWLWLVFIVNILALFAYFGYVSQGVLSTASAGLSMIAEVIQIVGVWMLLFKKKKVGFYVVLVADLVALLVNFMTGNIIMGIVSAVISILILYLAIRSSWDYLD